MQRAGSCTSSLRRILRLQNRVKRPCIILLSGGVAMIPYHFYYQLVVLGLLWLCVMLHLAWSSPRHTAPDEAIQAHHAAPQTRHRAHPLRRSHPTSSLCCV